MLDELDNSPEHLEDIPPSDLSTQEIVEAISAHLSARTARAWIVYLRVERPHRGSVYVEPPPERLARDGLMSRRDWNALRVLCGALSVRARRWMIFPDEIARVLDHLREGPRTPRRMWKADRVLRAR